MSPGRRPPRKGWQAHARIASAAASRNERSMSGLPENRRALSTEFLDLLTPQAQRMLDEEGEPGRSSTSKASSAPLSKGARLATDRERPLLVSPEALRDLHRRLGELLRGD